MLSPRALSIRQGHGEMNLFRTVLSNPRIG